MNWLVFAIAGYFFYAIVTVINKFLLRQPATTKPLVFTFWLGVLSIFTFALAPFGLGWPGWGMFIFDIFTGFIFFLALLAFYRALDINEAFRVASVIGGLTPIFIFLLSWLFLREHLTLWQILAFLVLTIGGFLLSLEKIKGGFKERLKGIKMVIWAILLGAIYMVFIKYIFNQQGFITGFIWTRLGVVLAAAAVLLWPNWRRVIFSSARQASGGLSFLFGASKTLAGFGSFFIHLGVVYGSVTLVSAMAGTEYVFLLISTVIISKKFPEILREKSSRPIIIQKIIAILLIGGGLAILAV